MGNQRPCLKESQNSNADFDSFFDYANLDMEGSQDSFFNL